MESPLKWVGGKRDMVSIIIPLIPKHKMYIEPFFGSGKIFFAKPPSSIEIINDLNGELVNFFKMLRDLGDELARLMDCSPYSRQFLQETHENFKTEKDPLKRAWMFYVINRLSYRGSMGGGMTFKISGIKGNHIGRNIAQSYRKLENTIEDLKHRLKNVQIDNRPAIDVIERYLSSEKCFIYLDPPYVSSTRKSGKQYSCEMNDKQHKKLLETITDKKVKANIMISGYGHPLYKTWLEDKGWNRVTKMRKRDMSGKKGVKVEECLWMNYKTKPKGLFCKP